MTVYCYDTEFLEDGKTIDLISIGIVCEDGSEYYAINSECEFQRIKERDWLVRNVVSTLPVTNPGALKAYLDHDPLRQPQPSLAIVDLDRTHTAVKPKWVIANEVRDFLLASDNPELWAYYGAYDHVALAQLYGPMINLPDGMPMFTHELMQLIEDARACSFPGKPPAPAGQHNALIDARWNMDLYRICQEALVS